MKIRRHPSLCGFTLIEVLVAVAILGLVVTAIYSSWMAIVKASKIGLAAAADAQRSRATKQFMETALTLACWFYPNTNGLYDFEAESGSGGYLSFVSRLPPDFPLSDSFDTPVRRVTFQLEDGQLRMSQKQLLDEDEAKYFVPLAHNVKDMRFLFFDRAQNKWVDEWKRRNLLPERIKISLRVGQGSAYSTHAGEEIVHIVGWPLTMVPISPLTPRTPPP